MAVVGMSEDTLSIRYARALVDAVVGRGASRSRLLEAAQWDPQRLDVMEGRIPSSELGRLIDLAIELTGDPALGLHTVQRVRMDSVDLVGRLVTQAGTLREALDSLTRQHKLLGDDRRFHLIESDREVTLRYESPRGLSVRARRYLAEMHISGNHMLLRCFARDARPVSVCFDHPAPAYPDEYQRVFKGTERFGQPFAGIVFDRTLMDAARRYHDEEFYRSLCELAEKRTLRLERGASYAARVCDVVAVHEAPGKATMVGIAQALGMSMQSLRRRLAAEDTSYEVVFSEALASKARRLLSVEQRTVQETAHAMGYSDTSAFYRAFKRWTGTTPRAWRMSSRTRSPDSGTNRSH